MRNFTSPDVEGVEVGAVEHAKPEPGKEENKEAMDEVAHAVAGKHAVVLSLQYAYSAN